RGAAAATPPIEESFAPADSPAAAEDEATPWHDPALPMEDRLKLTEGKAADRQLMAAMAQLDCGACGYVCKAYAHAIASGEEKDLTKCAPGGRDTVKTLKEILAPVPLAQGTVRGAAPAAAIATV